MSGGDRSMRGRRILRLGVGEEANPRADLVTIEILDKAEDDLVNGFAFSESQQAAAFTSLFEMG